MEPKLVSFNLKIMNRTHTSFVFYFRPLLLLESGWESPQTAGQADPSAPGNLRRANLSEFCLFFTPGTSRENTQKYTTMMPP